MIELPYVLSIGALSVSVIVNMVIGRVWYLRFCDERDERLAEKALREFYRDSFDRIAKMCVAAEAKLDAYKKGTV